MTASTKIRSEPETNGPPDKPTFKYQPSEEAAERVGPEPIVIPKADALWEDVDGKDADEFLWEIRKLNELYQMYEFLDRAQIPQDVQRRVVRLPRAERREMLKLWFADMNGMPRSEGDLPPES